MSTGHVAVRDIRIEDAGEVLALQRAADDGIGQVPLRKRLIS